MDIAYDVATGGHVALVWLRLGDVDNAIEQVRFAMLAAEVLGCVSLCLGWMRLSTDSAEDVIVVREMGLAVLAAVDTR